MRPGAGVASALSRRFRWFSGVVLGGYRTPIDRAARDTVVRSNRRVKLARESIWI
jgi:hypothetical protein